MIMTPARADDTVGPRRSFRGFFSSSTRQARTWYEKAAPGRPTTSGPACSDQLHPPDLAWARTCNENAAAAGHTSATEALRVLEDVRSGALHVRLAAASLWDCGGVIGWRTVATTFACALLCLHWCAAPGEVRRRSDG